MKFIASFRDISTHDVALVGGKNASLGEMIRTLTTLGVQVPDGFALTAAAYWHHIKSNNLEATMRDALSKVSSNNLAEQAELIRSLIIQAPLPDDLKEEVIQAYCRLSRSYGTKNLSVAVRSSATAEDLPTASFAGQQETYLHIRGDNDLLDACKRCMASLFTERAMIYRREQGFDDMSVALSVGVQKMIQVGTGAAGVMFTLDTETGFSNVITINASYGLGELLVQGQIIPDEWYVHKLTLEQGFRSVIKKTLGTKTVKLTFRKSKPKTTKVSLRKQQQFSLNDNEVLELAKLGLAIEKHYSTLNGHWTPMDIEWAKDGKDGKLYIVQARPETVHKQGASPLAPPGLPTLDSVKISQTYTQWMLTSQQQPNVLVKGQAIGRQIVTGIVKIVNDSKKITVEKKRTRKKTSGPRVGDPGLVLVTRMTDPDWLPLLKKSVAVITDIGGRTCHAAIVSRELGIPAVIGTHDATTVLRDGQEITLDCSQGSLGYVYEGSVSFTKNVIDVTDLPTPPVDVLINLADPDRAFAYSFLPVKGIGLARLEFIMVALGVHPMAAALWDKLEDKKLISKMKKRSVGYENPRDWFVQTLAQGIATIAAAFYPRPVVVRLSDFKTNEYKDLLGGALFEGVEENPMLGFRGAVRYSSSKYAPGFALECEALMRVRTDMGLTNVIVMVPFVRTVDEAKSTLATMEEHGLIRGKHGLKVFMMVEIPSNVILIDEFAPLFDGLSIGSNDLTQLTLGVDRDSGVLANLFDERDPAVQKMLLLALQGAQRTQTYISICGQAPSDFPEIADLLIEHGINALSLNPDVVLSFLMENKPKS